MPTATHSDASTDTTARTVLTYVVLALLAAFTWSATFVVMVLASFGYASCGKPYPSDVLHGRLVFGATMLVAALVWTGLWWLTGRRVGVAVLAVCAVFPTVALFAYGLLGNAFWADGWCFG